MSDPTLHLKRDELRPEVRSYVDNLRAQVLILLKQHNAKDTAEFERLAAEKKVSVQDVQKMKDLLEKFAAASRSDKLPEGMTLIVEQTPEGELAVFDLHEVLAASKKFYKEHNLPELAESIPDEFMLHVDAASVVRDRLRQGFTEAIIMPPEALQFLYFSEIHTELGEKPVAGLSAEDQYHNRVYIRMPEGPYVPSRRARGGPYLLLFPKKVPQEAISLNFRDSHDLFAGRGWNGLTREEFFVIQRRWAESRKSHRIEDTRTGLKDGEEEVSVLWLTDIHPSPALDIGITGSWDAENKRVDILEFFASIDKPFIGALPTQVLELR